MLARKVNCQKCPLLVDSRTQIVEDTPLRYPLLLVIGEAPGVDEDRVGRPFVGTSGRMIREALVMAFGGLPTEALAQVVFTNAVRCHPEKNRNPKADEMNNCRSWLEKEIEALAPKNILCLGRFAKMQMDAVRHHDPDYPIPIYYAYHPGAAIYGVITRQHWYESIGDIVREIKKCSLVES